MGIWFAAQQQVVTLFNLLKRISVVVPAHMTKSASARSQSYSTSPRDVESNLRSHGNVTTINDLGPRIKGVRLEWDVVATTKSNSA